MTNDDVMKILNELNPAQNPKYRQFSDIALSRLFADIFKGEIRFNTTHNSYDYFDGKVWKLDEGNMKAEHRMKQFSLCLWAYAGDKEKPVREVAERMQGRNTRKRILDDAKEHYSFNSEDLDAQENLLNCQNGVLDLNTFELLPHDPEMLLSKICNVHYDADATGTLWLDTIVEIFQHDTDLVRFMHQLYGMSLTCYTGEEQFYLEYGASTRNGKSTMNDVIAYLMGDYCCTVQPETLMRKKKDSRQASGDVARLKGARLVLSSEPDKRSSWDVALIKQMTGGDIITARHLREREMQFRPVFKLIINTNHLPIVSDSTLFDSDRVLVIPFEKHFTAAERDRNLKRKLKTKENLSGILNWLLEGLRDFRENGLVVPDAVYKATEDYSQREDKFMTFLRDRIEDRVLHGDLKENKYWTIAAAYNDYTSWCDEVGMGVDSRKTFTEEVKKRGLFQQRGYICGVQYSNLIKLDRVRELLEIPVKLAAGFEPMMEAENEPKFES